MRRIQKTWLCFTTGLLALCACVAPATHAAVRPGIPHYGIRFVCAPEQVNKVRTDMQRYLQSLGISASLVQQSLDASNGTLSYALLGSPAGSGTLYLAWRPELGIEEETLQVPTGDSSTQPLQTVSRKEIVLALLHPGRLTEFKGRACDVQALIDQVGIRQNTVMWAERLSWGWPDGAAAEWNPRYWYKGTPHPHVALHDALNDLFFQQDKYAIGCYTATKIVFVQAVLDYYRRIKKDATTTHTVTQRLQQDGEPLVDVEPGRMWSFETDFEALELNRPGKILHLVDNVAPGNFVPGDWIYFLNTDARTYQRTGYEGSNAIYLGRNRFDDYYNDNLHHYNYKEKLNEVYQWRNGVFSRARDYAKRQPMSPQDYERLSTSPEQGGLLMAYRVVPYQFGFEKLPPLSTPLAPPPPPRGPAPGSPEKPGLPLMPAASGG